MVSNVATTSGADVIEVLVDVCQPVVKKSCFYIEFRVTTCLENLI